MAAAFITASSSPLATAATPPPNHTWRAVPINEIESQEQIRRNQMNKLNCVCCTVPEWVITARYYIYILVGVLTVIVAVIKITMLSPQKTKTVEMSYGSLEKMIPSYHEPTIPTQLLSAALLSDDDTPSTSRLLRVLRKSKQMNEYDDDSTNNHMKDVAVVPPSSGDDTEYQRNSTRIKYQRNASQSTSTDTHFPTKNRLI